jgi:hypothetical protein
VKYPGLTVLVSAWSGLSAGRDRPSSVNERIGSPCMSSGTAAAIAAASIPGVALSRSSSDAANSRVEVSVILRPDRS